MDEGLIKAICFEIFLIIVGFFGYYSFFVDGNIRGLTWGIACSLAFAITMPIFICVIVSMIKDNKKDK